MLNLVIKTSSLDKMSWWQELYNIRKPNGIKIYTRFKNDYDILHGKYLNKEYDFYCYNQLFDMSISDMRYSV